MSAANANALFDRSWSRVCLGDIYDIGSSKRVLQRQWKSSGVPFYRAREIVKLAQSGSVDNELFISEEHFEELRSKTGVPQPGDLMVSAVGTLGACYVVQEGDRFYFKDASVLWFRPKVEVEPRFMQYAFLSDDLLKRVKSSDGATVGTFTISRARNTEIVFPPVDEQKLIVAVLDQAFAALDRARALVEANSKDAQALLDRFVSLQTQSADPSWIDGTLGTIYDVRDGTHDSPKYQEAGYPLITSKNLGRNGLNFDKVKLVSEKDFLQISKRSAVHAGDVLFAMIGTIGNAIVVGGEHEFAIKNVALFKATGSRDGRFLRYLLNSSPVRERMLSEAKGTTQKFVGLGYLRNFPVRIPPVSAEPSLIAALEAVDRSCESALAHYQKQLSSIGDLRKSMLDLAFSGQLTWQ